MSFDVGVNDNVLITPALPYGRSYYVMGVVVVNIAAGNTIQ